MKLNFLFRSRHFIIVGSHENVPLKYYTDCHWMQGIIEIQKIRHVTIISDFVHWSFGQKLKKILLCATYNPRPARSCTPTTEVQSQTIVGPRLQKTYPVGLDFFQSVGRSRFRDLGNPVTYYLYYNQHHHYFSLKTSPTALCLLNCHLILF